MIGILKGPLTDTDRDFFAVEALNRLAKTDTSASLFCDGTGVFHIPLETNVMQRVHAFSYDGILITDSLMRCQDLIYAPYAKKRLMYCYHLDWPFINNLQFAHVKTVLLNESIEYV